MSNAIVDTNAFIDGLDPCDYEKVFGKYGSGRVGQSQTK